MTTHHTKADDYLRCAVQEHEKPYGTTELSNLTGARKAIERATAEAVQVARQHGHSWAAIGEALEITKQAAQQRFGSAVIEVQSNGARFAHVPGQAPLPLD